MLPVFLFNSKSVVLVEKDTCCSAAQDCGFLVLQDGQDIYLEVFHAEVEAFIQRVKEYAAHESTHDNSSEHQLSLKCSLVPKDVPDTSPPVSAAQTGSLHSV